MYANRQWLTHRPLLKSDPLGQLVTQLSWVVNKGGQGTVHWGCSKELNVRVKVVAPFTCCAAVPAGDTRLQGNRVAGREPLYTLTNLQASKVEQAGEGGGA